jgi:hypothetical protein
MKANQPAENGVRTGEDQPCPVLFERHEHFRVDVADLNYAGEPIYSGGLAFGINVCIHTISRRLDD